MSTELPPLPEPEEKTESWRDEWGYENWNYAFSADQMRAYARAAVEAEREACARLCDERAAWEDYNPAESLREIAEAIRQRGKQ